MRVKASYRLLAGALAFVWAVLPVALGAHSSAEKHGYCAEHERIEHTSVLEGDPVPVAVSPARAVTDGTGDQSPAHDWCPLAEALAGHAAPAIDHPTFSAPLPVAAPQPALVVGRCGAVVSILRVAPKCSPPSLAV